MPGADEDVRVLPVGWPGNLEDRQALRRLLHWRSTMHRAVERLVEEGALSEADAESACKAVNDVVAASPYSRQRPDFAL